MHRTLFEKEPNLKIVDVCDKEGAVYSLKVRYGGLILSIRDSLKLIPESISKFTSTFQLHDSLKKKDDFTVYTFFEAENADDSFTCTPEYYAQSRVFDGDRKLDAEERGKFLADMKAYLGAMDRKDCAGIRCPGFCCNEGKFHPWMLYKNYLCYDVLILAGGLLTFQREMSVIAEGNLDVLHSLTVPSFSNRFMGFNGAFEGMHELSGSLRAYQSQAVAGGRVMVNPAFEGRHCRGKFAYLDAIGLYPSAIAFQCEELGGFPTGPAQLLTRDQLNYSFLRDHTRDYTVCITITRIGKRQFSIPFILLRSRDGSMDYINDLPNGEPVTVTVDRVTLEDYIEFHRIEFTILQGMFWTGPGNSTFGTIQRRLHVERNACKKAGDKARANIYKLIQNSAYGKLLQKTSPTGKKMIQCFRTAKGADEPTECNWRLTLYNKLHLIKTFRFVGEHQIETTEFKLDDSHTLAHIGSKVLAASKRLMNRLFALMSDMKIPIQYTDTDSFCTDFNAVHRLGAAYAVRYGKDLIGDNMMQFHSDFTFNLDGKAVDPDLVYSTDFFPMGRKLYCHQLEAVLPDGRTVNTLQFKSKGCTREGLLYKAREYGAGDDGVIGLYTALSSGESVECPLNPPGKARFEYNKENQVTTHGKIFYRSIRSKAAEARVARERKAEEKLKASAVRASPLEEQEEEEEEEVPGFYDLPDSTIDSWRSQKAAVAAAASAPPVTAAAAAPASALAGDTWPEDVFDPHYDSVWNWWGGLELEGEEAASFEEYQDSGGF